MTRTLPWLKDGSTSTTNKASNRQEPRSKRRRVATPADSDHDLDVAIPSRRRLLQATRTPSTSPPPAPPEQHLMREGFTEDDIWMMVEDEFYTTAQAYTQHLHHAEYQRLKKAAKERESNNEVIQRPTDGTSKLSLEGQRSLARGAQEKSVKEVIRKTSGQQDDFDEEDDADPWLGTQLAGLMDSPRKVHRLRAKGMVHGRSVTKASKGFTKISQLDSDPGLHHKQDTPEHSTRRVSFENSSETRAVSPTSARKQWREKREVRQVSVSSDGEGGEEDDLDAVVQPTLSTDKRSHPSSMQPPRKKERQDKAISRVRPDPSTTTPDSSKTKLRREDHMSGPTSTIRGRNETDNDLTRSATKRATSHPTMSPGTQSHGFSELSVAPTQSLAGGAGRFAKRRAEREKARLEKERQEKMEKSDERRGSADGVFEVPTFL